MSPTHIAGIDAGGTTSRILLQPLDPGGPEHRSDGPGANLQVTGVNGTAKILYELVLDVHSGDLGDLAVVAGVAGAGREADQQALREALARRLGVHADRVGIVSDVDLAMDAAFGVDGTGLVVIAGTGSIVCAREPNGALVRAGGWGRVLGDEGSGYAIGRAGLAAVADAIDGGPATTLAERASIAWNAPGAGGLIEAVYRDRRNPASFAPHVLQAAAEDDAVALRIVRGGVESLAERTAWVASRCRSTASRIALWGGLMGNAFYRSLISATVRRTLPDWTLEPVRSQPLDMALERARRVAAAT